MKRSKSVWLNCFELLTIESTSTRPKFFCDIRGRAETHKLRGPYHRIISPFSSRMKSVGHSVRAGYFYLGSCGRSRPDGRYGLCFSESTGSGTMSSAKKFT
jgi:hypothetical protein